MGPSFIIFISVFAHRTRRDFFACKTQSPLKANNDRIEEVLSLKTVINIMDQKSGKVEEKAVYALAAKQALISYIMQFIHKDFHTWLYPETISGMEKSKTRENTWYFKNDDILIQAFQVNPNKEKYYA